jgi:hypothetical protein
VRIPDETVASQERTLLCWRIAVSSFECLAAKHYFSLAALYISNGPLCLVPRCPSAPPLFVDDRWLRLSRLPDFRQVAAGQDGEEAGYHHLMKAQLVRDGK